MVQKTGVVKNVDNLERFLAVFSGACQAYLHYLLVEVLFVALSFVAHLGLVVIDGC